MLIKLSKVVSIERLNLSSLGSTSSNSGEGSEVSTKTWRKKSRRSSAETLKYYSSFSQLFVLRNNEITVQNFEVSSKSNKKLLDSEQINRLISHKSSITCLGLDENYGLVCSCSDDEVILWKYNPKTKSWNDCKIGEDFGKISCCSVSKVDREIFVNLVGTAEIIVLKCSSSDVIELESKLSLTAIDMLTSIESSRLQINWIRSFYQNGRLFIAGISSGNSISFRIWEIAESTSKLIDQKTSLLFKSWASIDFIPFDDFHMILIISPEGWTEIYRVTCDGFAFITHFKIEECIQGSSKQSPLLQMDFRILAACFLDQIEIQNFYDEQSAQCERSFNDDDINNNSTFCEIERPAADSKRNSSLSKWKISVDSDANDTKEVNHGWLKNLENSPEEVNSSINFQPQIMDIQLSPKLLFCVISSVNISFYNALSGEVEFTINFKDLVKEDIVINSAKICILGNEIVCSIHPFFQTRFLTIRFQIEFSPDVGKFSFISSTPIEPKSVLMKNLKISISDESNSTASPALTRSRLSRINSQYNQATLQGPEYLKPKSRRRPPFVVSSNTPRGSRDTSPNNNSSYTPILRSVKIQQSKTNYFEESLKFCEKNHYDLSKRLSDNLSYIRLAMSRDGKFLAGGGSNSPFLVMKTRPIFDSYQSFKDFGRVACTNFSFCTKYLLVGTNDCKSSLLDITSGKKLLDFDFTSKFNEHVDVQFYFLDKFILQPEANRLALYSYQLGSNNGSHKKLQAGSFNFDFQSITAVATPNQFYSNLVLCAGSNKTLSVLDENHEKLTLTIPFAHTKPISCIKINESPKSFNSLRVTDFFLTSAPTPGEPIKFWDLRLGKCVSRVTDINPSIYLPTSRPSLSPSGLYIASGCEENSLIIYDVRKINSRVTTIKTPIPVIGNTGAAGGQRERGSDILDCHFDPESPMIWCGYRNGNLYNYFAN